MVSTNSDQDPNLKESFLNRVTSHPSYQKSIGFLVEHRRAFLSGILMLIGLAVSFYYWHLGGCLVGLAVGLCFFEEIKDYFVQIRDYYVSEGLFKTLMVIGLILYFLITLPFFIIALAIGFAAMTIARWARNSK